MRGNIFKLYFSPKPLAYDEKFTSFLRFKWAEIKICEGSDRCDLLSNHSPGCEMKKNIFSTGYFHWSIGTFYTAEIMSNLSDIQQYKTRQKTKTWQNVCLKKCVASPHYMGVYYRALLSVQRLVKNFARLSENSVTPL